MSIYHDEVEIEDFEYDEETETYYFPCPCGDRFAITKVSLSCIRTGSNSGLLQKVASGEELSSNM